MDAKMKQELLNFLNQDKIYSTAVGKIKDEAEQQKIKALSEEVFLGFINGLASIKKFINDNPEKVVEALDKKIHNEKKDDT